MLAEAIENKGNLDILDWLVLAAHYANAGEEEIAFQAYYMAHLLDHQKIKTNSELQFDTAGLT